MQIYLPSGPDPSDGLVLLNPETGTAPLSIGSTRGLQTAAGRRGSKSGGLQVGCRERGQRHQAGGAGHGRYDVLVEGVEGRSGDPTPPPPSCLQVQVSLSRAERRTEHSGKSRSYYEFTPPLSRAPELGPGRQIVGKAPNANSGVGQTRPQRRRALRVWVFSRSLRKVPGRW